MASREMLKRTYSLYIDAKDKSKSERLALVKNFLNESVQDKVLNDNVDYLTKTDEPEAARIGKCTGETSSTFDVKIFVKKNIENPTEVNLSVDTELNKENWQISSVKKIK